MLRVTIPGGEALELAHLVYDVNGTLAEDGRLLAGVAGRLADLSRMLSVHLLSADTYGTLPEVLRAIEQACAEMRMVAPRWERVASGAEKEGYVTRLGAAGVVAIGNGANDALMLREAGLGIAVLGLEGLAGALLTAAQVVVTSPIAALDLLRYPMRLTATLRR